MKSRNIYIQRDIYSCGACSIQSIVSYYGGYVPLNTVISDTHTTKNGTNGLYIKEALVKYGFDVTAKKIELESITNEDLPAIAHTITDGYEHFLVIFEIKKGSVVLMDPRNGKKIMKMKDFKNIYDNIIIIPKPLKKIVKYEQSHKLKELLINNLKYHKKGLISTTILSFIILILSLIINSYIKILSISHNVFFIIILFIFIILLNNTLSLIKEYIDEMMSTSYTSRINNNILNYIFNLDERYITNNRNGELKTKITDAEYIEDYILKSIMILVLNTFLLLSSLIIIFNLNKISLLIIIPIYLVFIFIALLTSKKLYNLEIDYINEYNLYNGDMSEYLNNLESIKNLGKESWFTSKLVNTHSKYKNSYLKRVKYYLIVKNISNLILELLYIILIAYNLSKINIYDVFILISFINLSNSSLTNITSLIPGFIHVKTLFNNISEFLDLKSDSYKYDKLDEINSVKINNLSYNYSSITKVLDNLNITINRGDKILVMGESGSGKSTFAKCISGHIKDYKGNILVNNTNILDYKSEALKKILYVGQNEKLFKDTLKNNITFDNYNEELYKKVIDISCINNILSKKNNTYILESASNYSGGEASRIILARSLYAKPEVLILDETLSSIPIYQEDEILDKLLNIKDLTLIYITHRDKRNKFKRFIKFRKDGTYDTKWCGTNEYFWWSS